MQSISNSRKIIYLLLLGLLPLVLVGTNFMSQRSYQTQLSHELNEMLFLAQTKKAKQHTNNDVQRLFADSDHFYIDKEVETIKPLANEIKELQGLLQRGFHPDEESIKRRLQFLTGPQNKISFNEGSVKTYKGYQETLETLSHPVEVHLDELKTLLQRLEGVQLTDDPISPSRPHLIITECKLEKKKGLHNEVYALDLKVLKREYLK